MKRVKYLSAIVVIAVIGAAGMVSGTYRQARGEEVVTEEKKPSPDAGSFWTRITTTDPYRNWKPYPAKGKEGLFPAIERGPTPAKNPHGGYMKLFVNDVTLKAAQQNETGPKPDGAILVMENYGRDRQTLFSVTAMYKVKGFAPEHGDWFWASYAPDGKVMEAGKIQSCIDCHRAKKDNDWTYAGSRGHHKGHK